MNPVTCFKGADQEGQDCGIAEDAVAFIYGGSPEHRDLFSVNGKDGFEIMLENMEVDYDRDGIDDYESSLRRRFYWDESVRTPYFDYNPAIAVGKNHQAVLQFFAEADTNQMPIRRVMIDWGDGEAKTNENIFGMYKNHMPDCADSNEDAGLFGKAPRACAKGYFTFTHGYVCDESAPSAVRLTKEDAAAIHPDVQAKLEALGVSDDIAYICMFKPKLQVLDNWGWCTGDCGRVFGGCYDGENNESLSSAEQVNQCDPTPDFPGLNPWIEYRGQIIVIPD